MCEKKIPPSPTPFFPLSPLSWLQSSFCNVLCISPAASHRENTPSKRKRVRENQASNLRLGNTQSKCEFVYIPDHETKMRNPKKRVVFSTLNASICVHRGENQRSQGRVEWGGPWQTWTWSRRRKIPVLSLPRSHSHCSAAERPSSSPSTVSLTES